MKIAPVVCRWTSVEIVNEADGEVERTMAMVPALRYRNVAAKQFATDTDYPMIPLEERSRKSHSRYFAALHDAFQNLPEKIAARWPTETHLRRWSLIECGWFDEKEFDCPDEKFAKRLALFCRSEDEYARISIHRPNGDGNWTVIIRRAKSQDYASMGKADFQASQKDVMDLLEHLTNVPRGALMKNAGGSA